MFKPNSQLRAVKANKELPKKLLQPELTQLSSHRLRLRHKHKLKLKLLLVQELVQLLLLPQLLELLLMLPQVRHHNTWLNRSLMEVSLLTYSSKDQVLNARLDKLLRFNIPEHLPQTVKFSTLQFQEDNQLLSPLEIWELSSAGRMPSSTSVLVKRLILDAQLPPLMVPHQSQEFPPTPILFST